MVQSRSRGGASLLAALVVAGCGNQARNTCPPLCGGPDLAPPPSLVITAAMSPVKVQGGPATVQLTATFDGADVTGGCLWSLPDPALGTVDAGGLLTTAWPLPRGGRWVVAAQYQAITASARIDVNYMAPDVIDVSAPAGAAMAFGGPPSMDPGAVPRILYPISRVMLPTNINQIEPQWTRAQNDRIFRLHFTGDLIDLSFYVGATGCAGIACRFKPRDQDWQTLSQSAAGGAVNLVISATAGPNQPVATSRQTTVNFSPEAVKGGFYYFSPSIKGLKRLPFGAAQATDFVREGSGTTCAGCHAVSRDGKKVAATFWGGDGIGGMVDGADGQKFLIKPDMANSATRRWNFASFSPDGTLLVTNWKGSLAVRDATTGQIKTTLLTADLGGPAVMPEWSPDGTAVVYVQIGPDGKLGKDLSSNLAAGDWIVGNAGAIAVIPYANGSFGAPRVVVPTEAMREYHIYPSWSPDSQWIVFATMTWPGGSPTAGGNLNGVGGPQPAGYVMSYDQDSARLRLVAAAGGAPIELGAATREMNKTTTWPKFAPFIQDHGRLVFVTYSAKFDYGFLVTGGFTPQLWMSAIDLDKARSGLGGDPSYPPFWLPFQNPQERNHSGIWATDVACDEPTDCPAEFSCQNGVCVSTKIQ